MIRYMFALAALLLAVVSHAQDYDIETVAKGLSHPWAMAFLPGGDILLTERDGQLRRISDGVLQEAPIENLPQMYIDGQGGLMDIQLDHGFHINQKLYISFSSGTSRANATTVISARLAGSRLEEVTTIFTASPDKSTPHHFGGRLVLLPDETLLVTIGEGFDYREMAQSLDNHLGKLVRINTDGSVPEDNPFVGDDKVLPEIYTYGHRNPQGLLVALDGTVWLHEHGPRGGDELNRVEPGRNYGWPAITHGMDYSGAYVSPYTEAEGMEQPVVYWTPSIAPGGFCEYQGSAFPQWRGNLFVAALAEKSVRRLVLENGEVLSQQIMFTELGERIREVRAGPDGLIYLLTDSENGKLLRIKPLN